MDRRGKEMGEERGKRKGGGIEVRGEWGEGWGEKGEERG